MASINKAIIVGHLGKDPEVRYTSSERAVCSFSVATSESWKKDGEKQERTEWHNITAFGKLAEICGEYLTKGKLVYIEGQIRTEKYEKDGETRYSTKIIADTMKMLGGGKGDGEERKSKPKAETAKEGEDDGQREFDDDIPF